MKCYGEEKREGVASLVPPNSLTPGVIWLSYLCVCGAVLEGSLKVTRRDFSLQGGPEHSDFVVKVLHKQSKCCTFCLTGLCVQSHRQNK